MYTILTCILIAFLSASAVASVFLVYMNNIDAELDVATLAGGLGLTTKIYYNPTTDNEEELLRLHGTENRIWVDGKNISPNIKKAFIAIEDHRFYEHCGIDPKRRGLAIPSCLRQNECRVPVGRSQSL